MQNVSHLNSPQSGVLWNKILQEWIKTDTLCTTQWKQQQTEMALFLNFRKITFLRKTEMEMQAEHDSRITFLLLVGLNTDLPRQGVFG